MPVLIRSIVLAVVTVIVPQSFCFAQQSNAVAPLRPRVPALVAIAPELEIAETPFRLARFGSNSPRDVILLAPQADAAVLTQAVEALITLWRQNGGVSTETATFRARQAQSPRVLPWAERVLQDARNAAPRTIPGMGRLQAVQIWLPAPRRPGRTSTGG